MYPQNGSERARQDIAEVFAQYDLSSNMGKLIATDILPLKQVQLAHGTYPILPLKELMKNPSEAGAAASGYAARRAPRSTYNRDDLAFASASYSTEEHGLEGVVDENEAAHYDSHFQHEATTAMWILHRLMIQRELRTASELFNTTRFADTTQDTYSGKSQLAGTYRETATGNAVSANAVKWSDYANATPIRDIFVCKSKIFDVYGVYPDSMVINELTYRHLRRCEEIRQQIMALGAGAQATQRDLTLQAIASVLDIQNIYVGASVIDANNPNNSAFSASHVWGNGALVFKKCDDSIRSIGLGHTLHWTADGSSLPAKVEDYYEPQSRTQVLRVRHQDRQLVKYDIGEFIRETY
jgi:hypothetical protein